MPILSGKQRPEPGFYISGWTDRFRMYRENDWKIVKLNDENWELYNIQNDPTEINNLADSLPEMVRKLNNNYRSNEEKLKESAR